MKTSFDKFECFRRIKVDASVLENGDIEVRTDFYGESITREIIHMKEKAVRDCLIHLGWMPPKENP